MREAEERLGLVESIASRLYDPRRRDLIRYHIDKLLRERIFSRALGYNVEDEADLLAHDPAMRIATWNRPGERVLEERIASQPTQSQQIDILSKHVAVPCYLLLARLWPMASLSFTCTPSEAHLSWKGYWSSPGLPTAWRMTGLGGAFRRYSLPFLISTTGLFGCYAGLYWCVSHWTGRGFLLRLLFYWFLLPLWSLLLVGAGGRLHQEWRERAPPQTERTP